jgi:2-polyprenyl-3-methyl-5-hydroxy-6-metoxy-1,4-benzoquinol methylase
VAAGLQLPALLDAYRTGGGVSWAQFGPDMRTGQAEMNRPWFMSELGTTWFPAVPHLQSKLEMGARVADFGCGEGWSSIAIAKAYPDVTVDGFDIDGPSIEAARRHAEADGVANRVTFHLVDAGSGVEGTYDVVTAFECIHDLPDPVSVLGAMHEAAVEDGIVVVMDEAVGERFGERTDEIEKLMYGFSIFICLPDGMSHDGSVATGTVMRPSTLETYARAAGFRGVEVLPIDNDLWRFYQLKA